MDARRRVTEVKTPHCANCSTPLSGRFCHICGQDDRQDASALEALGFGFIVKLVTADPKPWRTLLWLLFRPGELSVAYSAGKRASYLDPRKLYLFTSILFFVGLSLAKDSQYLDLLRFSKHGRMLAQQDFLGTAADVVKAGQTVSESMDAPDTYMRSEGIDKRGRARKPMKSATPAAAGPSTPSSVLSDADARLKTLQQMDRTQLRQRVSDSFSQHLPKMIFLLVPVFALIIWLFFPGGKKRYVDHLIFAFHTHAAFFTLAILCLVYEQLTHDSLTASLGMVLVAPHAILSTRRAYGTPIAELLAKLLAVVVCYLISLGCATIALAALTLWWM